MPIPAVVVGILELIAAALTAYETVNAIKDFYESYEKYKGGIEQAKKEIEKLIEKYKNEIDAKITEKEEVAILLAQTAADRQAPQTKNATGRGAGSPVINAAIQQKIPFRQVVGMVCERADRMPVIDLRRKKGVTVKDLPQAKRKILETLIGKTLEELAGVNLEEFIVVRMKQLAASLLFEFIDHCVDWKSSLKCEVSFGPPPVFLDPPLEAGSATKLKRIGDINPFYPAPHRERGSIAADLVITEYRKKKVDKSNIFAIVEIKFEGDKIKEEQFDRYDKLLAAPGANAKTTNSTTRYQQKKVNSGGRLALFRYPEDMPSKEPEEEKGKETQKKTPASKPRRRQSKS